MQSNHSGADTVINHSIYDLHVAIGIRIAHLVLIVEAVRPEVAATAGDGGAVAVKGLQERQGGGPVAVGAVGVEAGGEADAEGVGDLVQGGALRHVGAVGAEADVAVGAAVGGGDARVVFDGYGLGGLGGQRRVARDGGVHGRRDLGVGVRLVRARARGLGNGVRELGRGEAAKGNAEEERGELHLGLVEGCSVLGYAQRMRVCECG